MAGTGLAFKRLTQRHSRRVKIDSADIAALQRECHLNDWGFTPADTASDRLHNQDAYVFVISGPLTQAHDIDRIAKRYVKRG